jgi:acetyl esterase/lipase
MRIYKRDVSAVGLKPVIAMHGGSWKHRGPAFVGLESQISHLTERGFVVFAPFYRLVGNVDGNAECNGVTGQQIQADLEDAYNWVQAHKSNYGASGDIYTMGQSAGAHMAGMVAVNHPDTVRKAFLLYPPTDAQDFIARYQEVPRVVVDSPDAVGILQDYLGKPLEAISPTDPFVLSNSLPYRIATSAQRSKFLLLHGGSDSIVPVRQSVRMCNALYGVTNLDSGFATSYGGNPAAGSYRATYACDVSGSRLDIIAEADHALDFCVKPVVCQAGSDASSDVAMQSVRNGYDWLAQ